MSDCARALPGLANVVILAVMVYFIWRNYRDWRSAATRARIEGQARYWRMPV